MEIKNLNPKEVQAQKDVEKYLIDAITLRMDVSISRSFPEGKVREFVKHYLAKLKERGVTADNILDDHFNGKTSMDEYVDKLVENLQKQHADYLAKAGK